jgi:cell pole-organizing protein PopZ
MSENKPLSGLPSSAIPQSPMHDIIQSISRIIDEDERVTQAAALPRDKPGILELTEVVAEDDPAPRSQDGAAAAPAGRPAAPAAAAAEPGRDAGQRVAMGGAETAAAALNRLGSVAAELRPDPGPVLGHTGRTLEDIVRDALRPMLQAWLDQHLPRLVERLVQEEIDRLVRAARLR